MLSSVRTSLRFPAPVAFDLPLGPEQAGVTPRAGYIPLVRTHFRDIGAAGDAMAHETRVNAPACNLHSHAESSTRSVLTRRSAQ